MTSPLGPGHVPTLWRDRLASLIHEIRPDWGEPGIRAALARVSDRPLLDVALAALAACRRTDQRTPHIIALDGPHWPTTQTQRTHTEPGIATYCEHGQSGVRCDACYPRRVGGSGVGPTPEQRAQIRAALTERNNP